MNKIISALILAGLFASGYAAALPVQYVFTIENPVFDWRVNAGERVDEEVVSELQRLAPVPAIQGSFTYDKDAEGHAVVTDFRGTAWDWTYEMADGPVGIYRADEFGGNLQVQVGHWTGDGDYYLFLTWVSLNYLEKDGQSLDLLAAAPDSLEGVTGAMDIFFTGPNFTFHPLRVTGLVISAVPLPSAALLFGSGLLAVFARRRRARTT